MALPLPVASLISDCNLGPITVERRTSPIKNAFGGMDPSAAVNVIFDPITWHTLNGRDLLQVPEADRNTEIRQFYTVARLFVADGGQAADVVIDGGRRYRCIKVNNYDPQGAVFFTLAVLEDRQSTP